MSIFDERKDTCVNVRLGVIIQKKVKKTIPKHVRESSKLPILSFHHILQGRLLSLIALLSSLKF